MTPPDIPNQLSVYRTYKHRIYPTKTQIAALEEQLAFCCDLYNAALEQRRDHWKRGRSISYYDQQRELTDLRAALPFPEKMSAWAQQNVLKRLDRAFKAFFRRCKVGEKPGYPRFRSKQRYDSLTWSMGNGAGLRDGMLRLMGVGAVRLRWHREIPRHAIVKTITVKRSAGRWYIYFTLEVPLPAPLPLNTEAIGIDLGITSFAALSNGEMIEGPRAYRQAQRKLRIAQRRVTRRRRGSNRRRKAIALLARQHEHIRNIRRNHAHEVAYDLVQRFGFIAIEDLNIKGLCQGWLSKDVHDQAWSQFVKLLCEKAEWAAREVVAVNARNTSQICSQCGGSVPKTLGDRMHNCLVCGYTADRDTNAAQEVLKRGLIKGAGTQPSGANGKGEEAYAVV